MYFSRPRSVTFLFHQNLPLFLSGFQLLSLSLSWYIPTLRQLLHINSNSITNAPIFTFQLRRIFHAIAFVSLSLCVCVCEYVCFRSECQIFAVIYFWLFITNSSAREWNKTHCMCKLPFSLCFICDCDFLFVMYLVCNRQSFKH